MIKITNIHYSRTLFDYGFINLTEGHWASSWSLGRKSWQFCQVCTFLLEKYWTYLLYIKNYLWPEGVSWIWPRFSHARSRSLSKMHKSFYAISYNRKELQSKIWLKDCLWFVNISWSCALFFYSSLKSLYENNPFLSNREVPVLCSYVFQRWYMYHLWACSQYI